MAEKPTYSELENRLRQLENETEKQKRFQNISHTLFEISYALNHASDLNELFRLIHSALSRIIDTTNFFISLYNKSDDSATFPYCMDVVDGCYPPVLEISRTESLTAEVIRTGEPLLITKEEILKRRDKTTKGIPECTPSEIWLGVPLKIQDSVIGVMAVQSYSVPNLYDETDQEVMVSVADQVAIAIERKRAEDNLRLSEEKYRMLFDGSGEMISVYDRHGVCQLMNRKTAFLFGGKPDDFVGKSFMELHPASGEEYTRRIRDAIDTGISKDYDDQVVFPEDTRWLISRVHPLKDAEGNVYAAQIISQDITQFKQTEEKLQKSRALYHDLVETSQDLIWQCDADGRYTYVNPAFEEIFGYKIAEMTGKKFSDFQSSEYAKRDQKQFFRLMEGNTVRNYETVHLDRTGRNIHLVFNAKCIRDENGRIVGTRGTAHDITERKEAENRLRKAQKFNEAILASTPDVIYVYDIVEKKNIYSNKSISQNLGYSVAEIREMGEKLIESLMHPDDFQTYIETILPQYQQLDDNETIKHQYRMRHKSGQWRWLYSKESVFLREPDGAPRQIFGILSDITKQKLTEERIRKSEEEYRSLFNHMLDGFALHEIICDEKNEPVDYLFLNLNPAFERLTGLKGKDLIGKTVLEALPGIEKHWIETYGKVAKTGEPVAFENYAAELDKHFEVRAYRPAPSQFACIFQDITPRKKAEAERRSLELKLRQSQKMEAVGTLAGGIAHDFNNILYIMIGYLQMAMEDVAENADVLRFLEETMKAAERAAELVRQILAFSRKEEQTYKPCKIQSIIKESVKLMRSILPATIDISSAIDEDCGPVLADITQIHQIMMNLGTNARHAMGKTGGHLEIKLESVEVDEAESAIFPEMAPGPYLKLSVKDTGHGMDRATAERIFEPYFTTKPTGEGTGLGLSVVHGIVKNMGGHINVFSESGKGTVFNIFLPRIQSDSENGKQVDLTSVPTGNETILLVDDEEQMVNVLQMTLERLGYVVVARTSSVDALETFRENPDGYDLVITDMTMPKMTGVELSKELIRIRPNIPIVLCTGFSENISEEESKSLGVRALVMKPVPKKILAETIREGLS